MTLINIQNARLQGVGSGEANDLRWVMESKMPLGLDNIVLDHQFKIKVDLDLERLKGVLLVEHQIELPVQGNIIKFKVPKMGAPLSQDTAQALGGIPWLQVLASTIQELSTLGHNQQVRYSEKKKEAQWDLEKARNNGQGQVRTLSSTMTGWAEETSLVVVRDPILGAKP